MNERGPRSIHNCLFIKPKKINMEAHILSEAKKQTMSSQPSVVTPENFERAETDMYFSVAVKQGGFGKILPLS